MGDRLDMPYAINCSMGILPPDNLVDHLHRELETLLQTNPAATSSESFVQNTLEFGLLQENVQPRYVLRIGINYHGQKIQQLKLNDEGKLVGWNSAGDALATGKHAKMLLAGHTIFDRDPDEPMMNDSKIAGGTIPAGQYVRLEFKVRGWLGKTKNLDGKQLEKDIDLLKNDSADVLVIALSETAHRKWRGEGPAHQAARRTGTTRFESILVDISSLSGTDRLTRDIDFEGQAWRVSSQRVIGAAGSIMPGAEHIVTICRRR